MTFYPVRREPVKPVRVWYLCGKVHKRTDPCTGKMEFTGQALLSLPPLYVHECEYCRETRNLPAVSGQIQYETDEDHA